MLFNDRSHLGYNKKFLTIPTLLHLYQKVLHCLSNHTFIFCIADIFVRDIVVHIKKPHWQNMPSNGKRLLVYSQNSEEDTFTVRTKSLLVKNSNCHFLLRYVCIFCIGVHLQMVPSMVFSRQQFLFGTYVLCLLLLCCIYRS